MRQYLHGRIPGMKLGDLLPSLLDLLPQVTLIAVRSIDSTVVPELLRQIFERHQIPIIWDHGNVLLTRESLLGAIAKRLFTGFDELWFFESKGPCHDLRDLPRSTTDSEDFSVSVPFAASDAARLNRCVLMVGDGDGLNYLTLEPRIAEALSQLCHRGI